MNDFVEKEDEAFGEQLTTHGTGLDTHGATLGFSPAEISDAKADALLFNYILGMLSVGRAYGQELTDFKKLARKGNDSEVLPAALPALAANPTPAPAVTAANIELRFRQRAARAKGHPAYTQGIGEALKIVKPVTVFDPEAGTPTFKITAAIGGHPHIKFVKGGWQGVDIFKLVQPNPVPSPGPGPDPDPIFKKVERVFGHEYIDPAPLPTFAQAQVWLYKMMYVYNNQPVGNMSAIVSVTVTG